jgi:hypothetical protein
MLLSYKPAFLFVHIEKAAGSSIQIALRPFAPVLTNDRWRRRLNLLGPINRLGLYRAMEFPQHTAARTVKLCLPRPVYDGLFKFAFVRNPWDRIVSRHAHLLRSTNRHRHHLVKRMKNFEDFIAWEIKRASAYQFEYVTASDGRSIVDFVGRYEQLSEDFSKVCARLGIKAELPHANVSEHRDYRSYYTPETRELVAQHFRRDIELFGYTFDGLDPQSPGKFQACGQAA